ncbi:MAG: T9SS type A sorting domain-containing protein [Chitinophagales bacterium]|nr:T9SS type A sorting domain-containing protein [Chitinophagales bacterium]
MNTLYKILTAFLVFFILSEAHADRRYILRVVSVSTNIGDCDVWPLGDSDPLWRMYGDGDCHTYETTCNGCTSSVDVVIFDKSYVCASDVPTSIGTRLRGCENDGATSCSVPICDGDNVDNSWTETLPTVNGTGSNITRTATSGGSGCQSGKNFTMTYRWEVSGSFTVDNSNDVVCNAQSLGIKGPGSGTATVNYDNRCASTQGSEPIYNGMKNTLWYKFTTPAAPVGETSLPLKVYIKENGCGSDNVNVQLYKANGAVACTFPTNLNRVQGDYTCSSANSDEWFNNVCLQYGSEYYVQAGYSDDNCALDLNGGDEGCFQFQLKFGDYPAYDKICNAYDLSYMMPGGAVSVNQAWVNAGNFYNFCAGRDAGEPNSGSSDRTIWFKVKTGANVGDNLYIDASGVREFCTSKGGGSALSGAKVDIYSMATSDPSICSKDSLVTKVGTTTFGDDSDMKIECPTPDTYYYIQIQARNSFPALCEEQEFNVRIRMDNLTGALTRPSNDDICNAINIGGADQIVNPNVTDPQVTGNNQCASTQVGEAALGGANSSDRTIWYSFKTDANPPIEAIIDASYNNSLTNTRGNCNFWFGLANGTFFPRVRVYKSNRAIAGACTGIAGLTAVSDDELLLGIDPTQGSFKVSCLDPNSWYYVQIYTGAGSICDDGSFDIRLKGGPDLKQGPDYICLPASSSTIGTDGFMGTLNSSNNTDLLLNNQTTRCATTSGGEPDNTDFTSSINATVWYKFTTPPADYSDNTLMHVYDIIAERLSSSPSALGVPTTFPDVYLYKSTSTAPRACGDNSSDYSNLTYIDGDAGDIINNNGQIKDVCLTPNTDYYIQVDPIGVGEYVDFNIRVKKSAFRPGNLVCDATTIATSVVSGLNKTTTVANAPLTGVPFFGLPHTNKCASADPGEPDNVTPGGPSSSGNHTSSVWYQFTTDANPAEWIEWEQDDYTSSRGIRGTVCAGLLFNSKVNIYKSKIDTCVYPSFQIQSEYDLAWEVPLVDQASSIPGKFRLRCPEPNTTYYVQILDAPASPCFEGIYEPTIKTAPTTRNIPVNDDPCGAIFLGTVPVGGTVDSDPGGNKTFDNFCATPTKGFLADPSQVLDRDVWFTFIAPPSGSVLITAQSAPSGVPAADKQINLDIAVWDPVLGQANQNPNCSDPRYLWSPLISRNHGIEDYTDAGDVSVTYYDILDTKANIVLEGNSLIATCLNPGKMYYIQVDGEDYFMCDFLNGGDCTMGYFSMQVKDAGLYDMASNSWADVQNGTAFGNDEPCYAKPLPIQGAGVDYNSLNWRNGSNLCATGINDPLPSGWFSTDATVWYKFVAPASGKVKIRAENIPQLNRRDKANPNSPSGLLSVSDKDYHERLNLQLAVFTMGNCLDKSTLSQVASSYDGMLVEMNSTNNDDFVSFTTFGYEEYLVAKCLEPGRTYYIMVDGENDPDLGIGAGVGLGSTIKDVVGDFKISIQDYATVAASLNDNVCDAYEIMNVNTLPVNGIRATGLFNNECATIEPNIEGSGKVAEKIRNSLTPNLINLTAKKTLWFKFRAPSSGKVEIEAINSGNDKIDLGLALFDFPGEDCNLAASGFKVDEDYDPAIITSLHDEKVEIECLIPGRYYYLQVDGSNNPVACIPASLCATGEFSIKITHLAGDPRSDLSHTPPVGGHSAHDDLCDAINLGQLNPGGTKTVTQDNNRCSTEEINEPGSSGWNFSLFDDQIRSVWYRFNTGANLGVLAPGKFTITVNNPSGVCMDLDIDLFEYNGTFTTATCNTQANTNTQFNNLLKVGKGQPIVLSPRSETIEIDCPSPNTTYFLRVVGSTVCPGFGATMGTFDVKLQMDNTSIMANENDDICGSMASPVGTAPGNLGLLSSGGTLVRNNHNNFCASQELGEPETSQSAVQSEPEFDETMWYRFVTPSNPGEIKVSIEALLSAGAVSLPSITVYKGTSANYNPCISGFGGLINVASDMGTWTPLGGFTKIKPTVTLDCPSANWTYFVQVDGYDMALWGITPPGWLFSDNFTYNLEVKDNGSGSPRPANDKLANAIEIKPTALTPGETIVVNGHNLCATGEDNEPRIDAAYNGSNTTDHRNELEDETVWYSFITPAKPGVINVKVADDPAFAESFTPNFAIFYNNGSNPTYRITEAPSPQLIQEGLESSAITGTTTNKNYTCLLPNTRYFIQIDGNDLVPTRSDQGHFILTVADNGDGAIAGNTPTSDLICQAENITPSLIQNGTVTLPRTNYCSWEEMGEPNTSGNMSGSGDDVTINAYDETVWFKFRPAWEGQYEITVNNSHNYILYRSPIGTFDCTDPNWSNLTQMSTSLGLNTAEFSCLDNNVWYYLQVDGDDGPGDDVGPFNLVVKHVDASIPNHDMICSALDLGTINNTTQTAPAQNNICATQEIGEPNVNGDYYNINSVGYDKTLWYRFRTPAQIGEWNISIANQSPYSDRISASAVLYEATGSPICSGGVPVWSSLTERTNSGIANVVNGNADISLECFRLRPNTYYYIQVQGEDVGVFGEVGTNFNVSVTHTPAVVGNNDNVCTPQLLTIGTSYSDNNICAGTQDGEPDISPSPQHPFNSGIKPYDETMWYRFVAPAEGYVKIEGRSLASDPIDMNMNLYELPAGVTSICTGGVPNWSLLSKIGEKSANVLTRDLDYENECLIPGRTYVFKIDGQDALDDRGNYTVKVLNQYQTIPVVCSAVPNDEPCNLPGAYDLSAYVVDAPCSDGSMNYTNNFISSSSTPRIDCANRSSVGLSCGSITNCSDYWYKFTVPSDAEGGVKIQGDDEFGAGGVNNSKQVIGAYRGNPCTGQLQFLGCDYGGLGKDIEFDIAASPGETIYLQVFNDNAPNPSRPTYGLCISTHCEPKIACSSVPTLEYDVPQCWNLDEDNSPLNNSGGIYGNCLPGGATSANYFTFNTECGATADGHPDTLSIVFSVNNVGSNTALAIYEDVTPCDGVSDGTLINCVPFGTCIGCSPSMTFSQTYKLDECKTYVVQILGQDDDNDGSSGQIYIFKSPLEPPVLPVELISLTGYNNEKENILNWMTASEKNTEHFIVEKSVDAKSFGAIGIVAANGNSNQVNNYMFVDQEPVQGHNYYRLKIVDFDGKFEYSNIIDIELDDKVSNDNHTAILSVYPNPTDGLTTVEMAVVQDSDFEVKIVNTLGQVMHSEIKPLVKGKNTFVIDAQKYAQGAYMISIVNKATLESFDAKFVKQ